MRSVLSQCDSPVVFCHNDLLCGNFIYNEEKGSQCMYTVDNHNSDYLGMVPTNITFWKCFCILYSAYTPVVFNGVIFVLVTSLVSCVTLYA